MYQSIPTIGSFGVRLDLRIRQGVTFGPIRGRLRNPDGTYVDLTDCQIIAKMRKTRLSDTVTATFDCQITNPILTLPIDPDDFQFECGLDEETTASITAGEQITDEASKYVWDMEMIDSQQRVIPLAYGISFVLTKAT